MTLIEWYQALMWIIILAILLLPPIIAYKIRPKYPSIHVIVIESFLLLAMLWGGPWGAVKSILVSNPWSWYYPQFVSFVTVQIGIGLGLFLVALAGSIITLRGRWRESKTLRYYGWVIFVDYFILLPIVERLYVEVLVLRMLEVLQRLPI
jgi:hypothetical protein